MAGGAATLTPGPRGFLLARSNRVALQRPHAHKVFPTLVCTNRLGGSTRHETILATHAHRRRFLPAPRRFHLRRDICRHPLPRPHARDVCALQSSRTHRLHHPLVWSGGFTFRRVRRYQPQLCPTVSLTSCPLTLNDAANNPRPPIRNRKSQIVNSLKPSQLPDPHLPRLRRHQIPQRIRRIAPSHSLQIHLPQPFAHATF